jgi:hypothetical protein
MIIKYKEIEIEIEIEINEKAFLLSLNNDLKSKGLNIEINDIKIRVDNI